MVICEPTVLMEPPEGQAHGQMTHTDGAGPPECMWHGEKRMESMSNSKWISAVAFLTLATTGSGEGQAERCCEGSEDTGCLQCGCFSDGDCMPDELCDQDTSEAFMFGGVCGSERVGAEPVVTRFQLPKRRSPRRQR